MLDKNPRYVKLFLLFFVLKTVRRLGYSNERNSLLRLLPAQLEWLHQEEPTYQLFLLKNKTTSSHCWLQLRVLPGKESYMHKGIGHNLITMCDFISKSIVCDKLFWLKGNIFCLYTACYCPDKSHVAKG